MTRRVSAVSAVVDLYGLRLHARQSSRPGPPIVCVHGLAVSSRYMLPLLRELAAVAPVYAPDLPGFGRSAKPRRSLAVPELARALAGWLDATGVDRPILVANSLGCQVVAELAAREPERAAALVLVGPTVDARARSPLVQILRWLRSARYERPSLPFLVAGDALVAGPRRVWATFRSALADRIEEKASAVTAPTLVVRGENDPIVPQRWAEELASRFPKGRLAVVSGGGHALNYSRAQDLARLVVALLEERQEHGQKLVSPVPHGDVAGPRQDGHPGRGEVGMDDAGERRRDERVASTEDDQGRDAHAAKL